MTNYVVCPDCGYKLFKLSYGSNAEIFCPKCKFKLQIEIKDGKVAFYVPFVAESQLGYNITYD